MASMGGGEYRAEVNITSMTDVLLVLLILFLVVQPALTKGIDVQVPALEDRSASGEPPDQIVVYVEEGPTFSINRIPVLENDLVEEIRSVFEERERKVVFVKGGETAKYGNVVWAMDAARAAGIEVIGWVPRPTE